jgi:HAD superfamily hydrolase (TIGR01509 family)
MTVPPAPPLRPERIGAVLLDMDGTLVDSDAAVERAWTTWAERYAVDATQLLTLVHGNPAETTIRQVAPRLTDAEIVAAATLQLELQYADLVDVVATTGATDLLAEIERRRLPWAVVTSADRRLAVARLDAAGLPRPPVLITVEDVTHGKPHPEGYLTAAARLAVEPAACLVVEDSTPGITAGRAAGMPVVALRGLDGDLQVPHLAALTTWLRTPPHQT